MSKTYKEEYTKSKAFDKSCRNHGLCPYCKGARKYKRVKDISYLEINNE